jgi:hypothetical protein
MTFRLRFTNSTLLAVLATIAIVPAHSSRAETAECRPQAARLRQSLGTITQAVMMDEEAGLLVATEHLQRWWIDNRSAFGARPEADKQIAAIAASAQNGEPTQSAAAAVGLANASLDWCDGGPRIDDQLMRLDLVAMTAWLRARGENVAFAPHAYGTAEQIAEQLEGRGKGSLARQTRETVKAALAVQVNSHGDVKPATRLQQLVDKIERQLP